MFTRLFHFLVALCGCLMMWVAPGFAEAELDLSHGWWLVRQHDATSAPDARQAWLPMDVVEAREFRLSNPTEPGQSLWLKKIFPVPPGPGDDSLPWIVTVANRQVIRQALFNEQPLTDLENILPPLPTDSPQALRAFQERLHRWDQPARFVIPPSQMKERGNTLFLQIWDFPQTGSLLGQVQLRRATLDDLVILGVDRPLREKDRTAAVLVVQPRLALPKLSVQLQVRFGNEFGAIFREQVQELSLQGSTPTRVNLIPESEDETRAYVQLSRAGQTLEDFRVRLIPHPAMGPTNHVPRGTSVVQDAPASGDSHVPRGTSVVELTTTSARLDPQQQTLTLTYRVQNQSNTAVQATLRPTLRDKRGQARTLPSLALEIPPQQAREVQVTGTSQGLEPWSPWQPRLYRLTTDLQFNDGHKSIHHQYLGFRTWSIQGPHLLLNDQVVHLAGLIQSDLGRGVSLDPDTWTKQARQLRAQGVTLLREPYLEPFMLEVCDELGLFTGTTLDLVLSQSPDAPFEQALTRLDQYTHHPSLLLVHLQITDAVYDQATTSQLVALRERVAQLRQRYPSLIITVDGWGDLDGHDLFHNALHLDDPVLPARLDKPLVLSQGSRLPSSIWPGYGYPWMGDAALKLADHASTQGRPPLPTRIALQRQREAELLRAREIGAAIHWVTGDPWLTWRHLEPWLAAFPTGHATRFWLGEPTPFPVWVGNDSGLAGTATVQLELLPPGQSPVVLSHPVSLNTGESKVITFDLPALMMDSPTDIPVILRCRVGEIETSRHEARWSFHSRLKPTENNRAGLAILDPTGELAAMLEPLGVRLLPITSPEQLALTKVDLVVISPAVDPALMQRHQQALRAYVRSGGRVLVLIDQHLPAGLEPWTLLTPPHEAPSSREQTLIHGPDHPWLEGLLPEDFRHWQATESLYQRSLSPPGRGVHKVVTGLLPNEATLIEQPLGQGKLILCTLALKPAVVQADPAAARLLYNLVLNARGSQLGSFHKTLVLSPADSPIPQRLRHELRLVADYLAKAPEKLDVYSLILLADWQQAPTDPNLGPMLLEFVNRSGTLLVQNPSAKLMDWLGQALGIRFEKRSAILGRIHKQAADPLLSGISDALLAWSALDPTGVPTPAAALYPEPRELWIPEGGFELTRPALLVTRPLGRGRVIIDHSPWSPNPMAPPATPGSPGSPGSHSTPSSGSPGSPGSPGFPLELSFSSKDPPADIVSRYQRTILTNLRAELTGSAGDRTPSLVGLQLDPVPLAAVANRSRSDKTANDEIGFIDQGPSSQFTELPSGMQLFRGVPFHILPDQAETDRSILILRSKDRLTYLPPVSPPIPVNRQAKALFFLHSSAWAQSAAGSVVWEYEIHYADNPSPPTPDNPAMIKVPVQAGVDVGDWWGQTKVPGAVSLDAGQGQNIWVQRWDNPQPHRPLAHVVMRSLLQTEVPMLVAITAGLPAENLLAEANLLEMGFTRTVSLDGVMETQGQLAAWETLVTRRGSVARFSAESDPVEQQPALVIRHQQGPVAAVLQAPPVQLTQGQSVLVQFEYRTPPDCNAAMQWVTRGKLRLVSLFPSDARVDQSRPLPSTGGLWKTVTMQVQAQAGEGELLLQLAPQGNCTPPELWVRHLWVQAQTTMPR